MRDNSLSKRVNMSSQLRYVHFFTNLRCEYERVYAGLYFERRINYLKLGLNSKKLKKFQDFFFNFSDFCFSRTFPGLEVTILQMPGLFQVFHDRTNPERCSDTVLCITVYRKVNASWSGCDLGSRREAIQDSRFKMFYLSHTHTGCAVK